jgi:hypothetical protein
LISIVELYLFVNLEPLIMTSFVSSADGTIRLPPFPSSKFAVPAWLAEVTSIAITAEAKPGTLTFGAFVAEADWSTSATAGFHLGGQPIAPFVSLQEPERPAGNAGAVAAEGYAQEMRDYRQQQKDRRDFRLALMGSLQGSPQEEIRQHLAMELANATIPQLVNAIRARFMHLNVSQFRELEIQLENPFVPEQLLSDFLATHLRVHRQLAAFNRPLAEHRKVYLLTQALGPCHLYDYAISMFEHEHRINPDAATFDALSRLLRDFRPPQGTAGTHGYSAHSAMATTTDALLSTTAATKVAGGSGIPTTPEGILAMFNQMLASLHSHPSVNSATTGNRSEPKKQNPTQYCWTHGLGFHIGSQCRNPASGHVEHATNGNRLGGSIDVALPRKKRGGKINNKSSSN